MAPGGPYSTHNDREPTLSRLRPRTEGSRCSRCEEHPSSFSLEGSRTPSGCSWRAWRVARPGSRALILPYGIAYATLDAVAGISVGTVIQKANELPAADQAVARRLSEAVREPTVAGYVFYFTTALLWFGAALAVDAALRSRAPRPAPVLMALSALVFAVGHPFPTGPIGMGLLLVGVLLLEVRPRVAIRRHAASIRPT